jgi:hypothetical protein
MTTVGELIEELNKLDPSTRVFTKGYEGGWDDVELPTKGFRIHDISLFVKKEEEWWYGRHEKTQEILEEDRHKYEIVKGVLV